MNPFHRYPGGVYALHQYDPPQQRWWLPWGWTPPMYVGKTRRRLTVRVAEHVERQPWGAHIGQADWLYYSRDVSNIGLWWREIWFIVTRRPVFNDKWNKLNRNRIRVRDAERIYGRRKIYTPTWR